jgi:peptidyl-prolyl cis-trans isomerase D
VSDKDLETYLKNHQAEYKVEQSRDFDYISIPVIPSSDDTTFFIDEVEGLVKDFKQSSEDSLFARINSDGARYYDKFTVDQLPAILQANFSNLSIGDVHGPYFVDGKIVLYKVSEIGEDTVYTARASHILIKWKDDSPKAKNEARTKAQSLLNQLNAGADFAALARQNSEDGTAQNGGDLGWFTEGRMVKPFEKAVFGAKRKGLVKHIVESQFGYHIIDVTNLKTNTYVKLATIERDITPSDETRNKAFRRADYFASTSKNYNDFIANAKRDSLKILKAAGVGSNDRRFNDVENARPVIQWAYNDAEIGVVSPVKELDDQYIVAVLTKITEEGPAELEDVRDQVLVKVKNEKKGDIIIAKLQDATGTLNEMVTVFGSDAGVYSSNSLKLSTNSLPVIGTAPLAIGTVFSLKDGEKSGPVREELGIVLIELKALTKAPEIADYHASKTKLEQQIATRMSYSISEAIKKNADIKDERYRFF